MRAKTKAPQKPTHPKIPKTQLGEWGSFQGGLKRGGKRYQK